MPDEVENHIHFILKPAVDHIGKQGAGIGIVLEIESRAGSATTAHGMAAERKFGFTKEGLVAQNIQGAQRAQMLAISHALGLAKSIIKRGLPEIRIGELRKVTVLVQYAQVAESISDHVLRSSDGLEDIEGVHDRVMMKRVLNGIRKVACRGVQVDIARYAEDDGSEGRRAGGGRG